MSRRRSASSSDRRIQPVSIVMVDPIRPPIFRIGSLCVCGCELISSFLQYVPENEYLSFFSTSEKNQGVL